MKIKIVSFFILLCMNLCVFAKEPGNNLGKSVSELQSEFPDLRYSKSSSKGDLYADISMQEDGIYSLFWFRNGRAIEECWMVKGTDGFPRTWWKAMSDKFRNDTSYRSMERKSGHYKFLYSTFSIDMIYVEEDGINTAMMVYTQN